MSRAFAQSSTVPEVDPAQIHGFLRALADETRWHLMRLLLLSDRRAGELVSAVRQPANAVSYHLRQLRALGLVRHRQSSADARDIYYHVDLPRLQSLYRAAGDALHPALAADGRVGSFAGEDHAAEPGISRPRQRVLRVLFLCTHNSARSQMAEAIMRQMGGDRVTVVSAGSVPTALHADTQTILRELGIDPAPYAAKSLDAFVGQRFDYIITLCDRMRESCPVFPGDPLHIHWSFADPAEVPDPERRLHAFRVIAQELQTRIRYLLALPYPGNA